MKHRLAKRVASVEAKLILAVYRESELFRLMEADVKERMLDHPHESLPEAVLGLLAEEGYRPSAVVQREAQALHDRYGVNLSETLALVMLESLDAMLAEADRVPEVH